MSLTTELRPSYRALLAVQGLPLLVGSMLLARTAGTMVSLVLGLCALASAIDSNGYVVSSIFGPAIAGALVATVGSVWTLALTSAMYVVAAAITLGVRDPLGVVPHGRLLADAWAGIVYVARNATLRGLAVCISTHNVAGGLFYIGMPVLILTRLGGGPAQVGQLFALQGAVAAVSVLVVGRVGTLGRERQLLAGAMLVSTFAFAIGAGASSFALAVLVMVVLGLATGPFDVVLFTLRQRRTDPAWLGRAFAVSMSLNFVGFPVGSALGGALAPLSLEAAFVIALPLHVVTAVIAFVAIPATHHEQSGLRYGLSD